MKSSIKPTVFPLSNRFLDAQTFAVQMNHLEIAMGVGIVVRMKIVGYKTGIVVVAFDQIRTRNASWSRNGRNLPRRMAGRISRMKGVMTTVS